MLLCYIITYNYVVFYIKIYINTIIYNKMPPSRPIYLINLLTFVIQISDIRKTYYRLYIKNITLSLLQAS